MIEYQIKNKHGKIENETALITKGEKVSISDVKIHTLFKNTRINLLTTFMKNIDSDFKWIYLN